MRYPKITRENFWQRLDKNGPVPAHAPELGPCWVWLGEIDMLGYGRVKWEGKRIRSHRLALILTLGVDFNPDLHALHRCDNRPCGNPTHLYQGTHLQNMQDAVERNRIRSGEAHHRAKLTADLIPQLRERYQTEPSLSMYDIAREYGISQVAVNRMLTGRTWRREPGPLNSETKTTSHKTATNFSPKYGVEHHNSKLTPESVALIRQLRAEGVTLRALAERFGVSGPTIYYAASGRTWQQVA